MKVFHNRVFHLEDEIISRTTLECYVPKETVMEDTDDGKKKTRTRPAVGGLLFVHAPKDALPKINELARGTAMFYTNGNGMPARIPDREMATFKLVTSSGDLGLEYLAEGTIAYKVGQHVRVLDGVFKGAEGYICRIRGNRRLVVSISGICAVATSYIPVSFLERIPD